MGPADYHINGFYIFLTLFLVLLNGFFVAAEFSLVSVRRSRIEQLISEGNKGAKAVQIFSLSHGLKVSP